MKNENSNEKESDFENALEQDAIYAPDIESGKDITDITDIEKDEKELPKDDKSTKKQKNYSKKKTFTAEENDFNGSMDGQQEDCPDGSDKRIVIEKSPKERFARFDEELGAGAFKRVFRGYDYDTGREIAWNVINVHFMSQDSIMKIKEEINIIKKLNHPNIINFVSGFYNEEKNEIVIITEIFNSGSLKQHLNKIKHPRLKVIKFWCKEILKGLKYLHESQDPIIHRDIKCDNIFINPNSGQIKIGDLGYSCILRNNDYAKSLSGTPEFMAPEVLNKKYGVLADIYSFGICVLEIVTREKPYKECENNLIEIFDKIRNNILPNSLDKISNSRLLDFIKSCLKPDSERPSANDLLNSEFLNDLEHEENNYTALSYPECISYKSGSSRQNSQFLTSLTISNLNSIVSCCTTTPSTGPWNHQNKLQYENFNKTTLKRKASSPSHHRFSNRLSTNTADTDNMLSPFQIPTDPKLDSNDPLNIVTKLQTEENSPEQIFKINKTLSEDPLTNESGQIFCEKSTESKSKETKPYHFNYSAYPQEELNIKLLNTNDLARINQKSNFILNKVKNNSKNNVSTNKLSPFNPSTFLLKNGNTKNFAQNVSKIVMKIEEENKEDNSILISWLKKEKSKPKGQKISFRFNLTTDTCEGILNELKDEIGLNEEEKSSIMQKLSNLIINYTHSSDNSKIQKPANVLKETDPLADTKKCFDKFLSKFSKILETGEELLKTSKLIKEDMSNCKNSVSHEEEKDLKEKIKIIEDLLKIGL